jgi:mannitol/fructose-specific phosphotransferase system IIA component (Ntr-type)
MQLLDIIVREAIITDLQATTKEAAIREIVRSLQDAGAVREADAERVVREILIREEIGSTGIGEGLAAPVDTYHKDVVDRPTGTIALSRREVEWDALDGDPVDVVVLMISPYDPGAKLRAMETLTRHFSPHRHEEKRRAMEALGRPVSDELFIALLEEADRESPWP